MVLCNWCMQREVEADGLCATCLEIVMKRQHDAMAKEREEREARASYVTNVFKGVWGQPIQATGTEYAIVFGALRPIRVTDKEPGDENR